MGVPKFYRWISERYPCLSEVVKEYEIPEFDNLYLDMNGIIHICSHPNDEDPHFRISERDIFKDIFHYIEVLFRMVQPKKVFYMAVDGVAPRAKMNQQRGRRFRSAKEAEDKEKKAIEKGETLPTEARFDSNCITPGTEFMTKLDEQLQYFVSNKISSDKMWQDCTVIYSGHQTPGEGEHKIMEYIRYAKSQQDYDANTRHCLYGLDADLIMLGLTSHEPHFSLLREEVRFGKKGKTSKRTPTPEETTFHLLHLSLMREYLEYEFYELHKTLSFPFDLENIIDDWVLMGFLVGNDFIPHLPELHINRDALPILFKTYKDVLPTLDGYLNEGGTLNLKRFEKFMRQLSEYDVEKFHELNDNLKYIKGKQSSSGTMEMINARMSQMRPFEFGQDDNEGFGALEEDCPLSSEEVRGKLASLNIEQDESFFESDDSVDEEEAQFAMEFRQHKRNYYMTKMGYQEVTQQVLHEQAVSYVTGIQWILNYYYNGICSWSWFYPHHYAPYISDVKNFSHVNLEFELGKPFLPFEQLLAVLPPLSIKLLPNAYERLMMSSNSPLIDYYPKDFETDLNGKIQDWEAVVLIPFISESALLEAMKPCNEKLTMDERSRNSHGPIYLYKYTSKNLGVFKAPEYFPEVSVNHAKMTRVWRTEWDIASWALKKGLLPGVKMDVHFAGFPTLKHLQHTFTIERKVVKVFEHDSRGDSFVLQIESRSSKEASYNSPSGQLTQEHFDLISKEVFVNWPHLQEAKVVSTSSKQERFSKDGKAPLADNEKDFWKVQADDFGRKSLRRWGVNVGPIEVLVHVQLICGRSYVHTRDGKVTLEKNWTETTQPFPYQAIVRDIAVYDPGYCRYKTVQELFTPGSSVFMLGHPYYGMMGEVLPSEGSSEDLKGRIRISVSAPPEPDLHSVIHRWSKDQLQYYPAHHCAPKLGISNHLFARITGSVFLIKAKELNPFTERQMSSGNLNIGLNLKNNKSKEEAVGFTRKCAETNQWLYSDQCIACLQSYIEKFPKLFEFLNGNPSKNEVFSDEVFPEDYNERVPELTKWLKEAPFASAEKCKWGSVFVDPKFVDDIVNETKVAAKLRAKIVRMQVKPYLLFKPNPLQGSTPLKSKVVFDLFDRVINVREGFSVPLGTMGTVIGIQEAEKECDKVYTIVFDHPFAGGLTLAGPNSANRCYRLNWASMINVSHGNRENGSVDVDKSRKVKFSTAPKTNAMNVQPRQANHENHQTERSLPAGGLQQKKEREFAKGQFSSFDKNQRKTQNNQMPVNKIQDKSGQRSEDHAQLRQQSMPDVEGRSGQSKTPLSGKVHRGPGEMSRFVDTPQRDGKEKLAPPNPADLPKGFSFRSLLNSHHQNAMGSSVNSQLHPQASDLTTVPMILHGNFYKNWSSIKNFGLPSDLKSGCIPCLSYVPPPIGKGSYEIHIYLDVQKLLADQIAFYALPQGRVMCSTGGAPFLPFSYIEKVVDTSQGKVIFTGSGFSGAPHVSHLMNTEAVVSVGGKGRGKLPSRDLNPIERAASIKLQMESIRPSMENSTYPTMKGFPSSNYQPHYNSNRTEVRNRNEMTINELFKNVQNPQSIRPANSSQYLSNNKPFNKDTQQHPPKLNSMASSPFIPTQVARKHMHKKELTSHSNTSNNVQMNHSKACPTPSDSSNLPRQNGDLSSKIKKNTNVSEYAKKAKQKRRIAANFNVQST